MMPAWNLWSSSLPHCLGEQGPPPPALIAPVCGGLAGGLALPAAGLLDPLNWWDDSPRGPHGGTQQTCLPIGPTSTAPAPETVKQAGLTDEGTQLYLLLTLFSASFLLPGLKVVPKEPEV